VSAERFHSLPDAAAVFEVESGGWLYNSNAENDDPGTAWDQGGVGVLEFDLNGEVVGYRKIASGTRHNCGGGVTPWGSWISGEETGGGHAVQIDPHGVEPPRNTAMGDLGYYESFAFDDGTKIPTFYITRDHEDGLITRFTPNQEGYGCFLKSDSYERWCTLDYGTTDYLYLYSDGSIEWITDLDLAKSNSKEYHPKSEGIVVHGGILYFTAKEVKLLFTVDLRTLKYENTSTVSEGFDAQPDQIVRMPGDDSGSIYFCEDGGRHPGLHVRTKSRQFYTILHADEDQFENAEETTGIAFSTDAMHLYVSFQKVGIVYDVTRDDKQSFKGTLDTKIE
jgi:secreted PhoX family phosphatase